jgi:hypothetical protein
MRLPVVARSESDETIQRVDDDWIASLALARTMK